MTEPTTQAGRALLAEHESGLSKVKGWSFTVAGMQARILAIEAEAYAKGFADAERYRAILNERKPQVTRLPSQMSAEALDAGADSEEVQP